MSTETWVLTLAFVCMILTSFFNRHQQEVSPPAGDGDSAMQDVTQTKPTPAQAGNRRPRLDLSVLAGDGVRGERKRGKSMFGVLVNTLNKAKAEDKERNASEAVSKNN